VVLFRAVSGYMSVGYRKTVKKTASDQNFIPQTPEHKRGMLIPTANCCRRILFYETIKN
jgi:hypothetical protein